MPPIISLDKFKNNCTTNSSTHYNKVLLENLQRLILCYFRVMMISSTGLHIHVPYFSPRILQIYTQRDQRSALQKLLLPQARQCARVSHGNLGQSFRTSILLIQEQTFIFTNLSKHRSNNCIIAESSEMPRI